MTFWTEAWAYKQKPRSSGAKFVLVCVAHHADEKGYCYPSQKRLARMTMLSERAVRGHLHTLEEDELITRRERRSDGGFRSSDGIWLSMTNEELGLAEDSAGSGEPTGNYRQAHRQLSTGSPADSAGLYRDEQSVNGKGKGSGGNVTALDPVTRRSLQPLREIKNFPRDEAHVATKLRQYRDEWPDVDPVEVCKDYREWCEEKRKTNPSLLQLRNFFKQAAKDRPVAVGSGPMGRRNLDG